MLMFCKMIFNAIGSYSFYFVPDDSAHDAFSPEIPLISLKYNSFI